MENFYEIGRRLLAATTVLLMGLVCINAYAASDPKDDYLKGLYAAASGDTGKALKLLTKAADAGYNEANYELWQCYAMGVPFGADKDKALEYMRKAAEGGHPEAQLAIGVVYFSGELLPQDFNEGFSWILKSAEQGNVDAMEAVVVCYSDGYGTDIDEAAAAMWAEKVKDKKEPKPVDVNDKRVMKQPKFKGGENMMYAWLGENVRYPSKKGIVEKDKLIRVAVQFCVNTDGSISDVKIKDNNGEPEYGFEAKRLVMSMPNWEPGTIDGTPVKVTYVLPVSFKLTKKKK